LRNTTLIVEAVKRISKQDALAMKLVYNTFAREMLTLANRITGNLNDAEDVIQEAFLDSFQKIDQLNDPKLYGWGLKRIVANKSIRLIKKRIHFASYEDEDIVESEEHTPWYRQVKFEQINQEIQKLPDGCREVLTLYLMDGFKHRKIAELFGISESTSKSQYRYALKLLKEKLKKYCHDRI